MVGKEKTLRSTTTTLKEANNKKIYAREEEERRITEKRERKRRKKSVCANYLSLSFVRCCGLRFRGHSRDSLQFADSRLITSSSQNPSNYTLTEQCHLASGFLQMLFSLLLCCCDSRRRLSIDGSCFDRFDDDASGLLDL